MQRTGNRQHAVAAAQVGDASAAEVFRQVREEGAGPDVQAFTAEHVGVVTQLDGWCVQGVAGGVGRGGDRAIFNAGDQQPGFFDRKRSVHRPDVALKQLACGAWQVLDHSAGDDLGARRQLPL